MGTCFTTCPSSVTVLPNPPQGSAGELRDSVLVLLYDCPAPEHAGPGLYAGERLTLTSDDGDFMRVRSTRTGREMDVPASYVARVTHRWLFAGISRYRAEELLKHRSNPTGAFLIRESETNRDCYSLSILRRANSSDQNPVKHYLISRLQNGRLYISPELTFHSLHHLVEHYSESAAGLCCRLTMSCFIQGLDSTREAGPAPTTTRRPTINWKDVSRSMILKRKRTDSGNSLVSEGLREAINSYLQMTEGSDHCWDT
ncbi:src-like-adapter 2 [Cololabis saira]|uniref:src-like-adapter 2 n=1 Tax=Cololabis saira TaxID=129043 RepID=UPI002AD461A2|nr:src-like-adapter 2 [Cololabis saira]